MKMTKERKMKKLSAKRLQRDFKKIERRQNKKKLEESFRCRTPVVSLSEAQHDASKLRVAKQLVGGNRGVSPELTGGAMILKCCQLKALNRKTTHRVYGN